MSVTPMDLRNYTVPELRAELRRRHERGFDNGIEPNADGTYGLPKAISKMRKAELIDAVVKAAKAQERQEREEQPAEIGTALHKLTEQLIEGAQTAEDGQAEARAWYDNPNADAQGAIHEDGEDMTGHWAEQGADVDPDMADVEVFQGAMHEATTPEAIGDTLRVLANGVIGVAEALNTAGLAAQGAARKLAAVAWAHQVAVIRSMGRTVRGKVVDTVLREPGPDGTGRVCLVVEHPNGTPSRKATRTLHALADVQFEALAS